MNMGPSLGSLRASKLVMIGISPGLPDDQWIQEVAAWEAFVWTGYQTMLSASVIGPKAFDPDGDDYREEPTSLGDRKLCQSLRMRKSGGFANINVFALAFLTTFAILISMFSMFVLRFCIFLSRFRKALAPRIDRWVQDGIFQLQRRAFDAQDEGHWVGLEKEIPITDQRVRLNQLYDTVPIVKEMKPARSFETASEQEQGTQKDESRNEKEEEEEPEWKRFRVSVMRVDTSATLVGGDEQGKDKKSDLGVSSP